MKTLLPRRKRSCYHYGPIKSHKRNERIVIEAVRSGLIEIDEAGRIWRVAVVCQSSWGGVRRIKRCRRRRAEHFVGTYFHVRQTIDGKRISCMAHRLVWHYFKGPIPIGYEINHDNGRKTQNNPKNLLIATRSQNILHAFRTGLNKPNRGMKAGSAKYSDKIVAKCRRLHAQNLMSTPAISKATGISTSQVLRIVRNESRIDA